MQHDDTLTAIEFAGLSAYETWMYYCTMGGFTDYFEFTAYLHGLYALASDDADLVSEAVNELIGDVCPAEKAGICRAPYLWACAPESDVDVVRPDGGSDGAGGLDGFDDGPVRVPVDDLAEPHSAVTFGSGFLAGLDVSARPAGRACRCHPVRRWNCWATSWTAGSSAGSSPASGNSPTCPVRVPTPRRARRVPCGSSP